MTDSDARTRNSRRTELSAEDVSAALEARGLDVPPDERTALDLYTATLALEGDAAALRGLARSIQDAATWATTRVPDAVYTVDDLAQDLSTQMLTGAKKLAQYRGGGRLSAWLRTCAVRSRLQRRRRKTVPARSNVSLEEHLVTDDVGLDAQGWSPQSAAPVREAVATALAQLPRTERVLLRMHYLDGVQQKDLAEAFGKSPAAISRRLANVRANVRQHITQAMREHGIPAADIDVELAMDVSVRRFLATQSGERS